MKRESVKRRTVLYLLVVGCATLQTARANLILNGDFSDGLNGWTVESGNVTDGGGFALFEEHPTEILSTLKQGFTLPDWPSLYLVFDVEMSATPGGPSDPFAWPDAFTASLLDPVTLDPLVSNPGRTDFFYMDNTSSLLTIGTITITTNLTGFDNQDVVLYFDLIGSDDGMLTSAAIDNVHIYVPEPWSVLLWISGAAYCALRRRRAISR